MRDVDVLRGLRGMEAEIRILAQQLDRLMTDGAPDGYGHGAADGMGKGTNHQEAARQQHIDYVSALLETRKEELKRLRDRFEEIVAGFLDSRVRVILRSYYALGMTDEAIGWEIGMSTRRVNAMRNESLRRLKELDAA